MKCNSTEKEFLMTHETIDPAADSKTITERVRERYARMAESVRTGQGCCSTGCDPVGANLYDQAEIADLPKEAVLASLGCGNPTALIDLKEGEVVLDLGSGGGIDVLLAARRVGPTGFVFGLDMTEEMLALALGNKAKVGMRNVAFLKGHINDIPLPANSVDVVISNCVINLAADKSLVLRDAFRVLKHGGRFAVADVVIDGPISDALRRDLEAWVGCVAGALDIDTYVSLLQDAGFEGINIEITRRYSVAEAGLDPATLPADWSQADGKIASAFIRAAKPIEAL
jgi:arsenite methyltransferase